MLSATLGIEPVKFQGEVYCYCCTRPVRAQVTIKHDFLYRKAVLTVIQGQRCPRCATSLDAALVLERWQDAVAA